MISTVTETGMKGKLRLRDHITEKGLIKLGPVRINRYFLVHRVRGQF